MFFRKKNKTTSHTLEKKGDDYARREKVGKALEAYRRASELDPENPVIYDKLSETLLKSKEEWTEKEFAESLSWTMKKQELENPLMEDLHDSLSPEYQEIRKLISQILTTPPELRDSLIVELKKFKEKAVRPLLDVLLTLDEIARKSGENPS